MVRPVVYKPTKAFTLSDAQDKYKEIAEAVKAASGIDAKAAASKVETCCALAEQEDTWTPESDKVDSKDAEFVGIVLGGMGGGEAVSGGALEVDLDSCYLEEPRIVVEEDDAEDEDERSLWGDGDKEP